MDPDPYPSDRPTQAQVTRTLLHLGACVAACCTACAHTHPALRTTQLMPQCSAAVGVRGWALCSAAAMFRIQDAVPSARRLPPFCPVSPLSSASHRARSTCAGISPSLSAPHQHRATPPSRDHYLLGFATLTASVSFAARTGVGFLLPPSYVISTCRCPPIRFTLMFWNVNELVYATQRAHKSAYIFGSATINGER